MIPQRMMSKTVATSLNSGDREKINHIITKGSTIIRKMEIMVIQSHLSKIISDNLTLLY
jgi:hypothetical protein